MTPKMMAKMITAIRPSDLPQLAPSVANVARQQDEAENVHRLERFDLFQEAADGSERRENLAWLAGFAWRVGLRVVRAFADGFTAGTQSALRLFLRFD
jgi:hypothetical protein